MGSVPSQGIDLVFGFAKAHQLCKAESVNLIRPAAWLVDAKGINSVETLLEYVVQLRVLRLCPAS